MNKFLNTFIRVKKNTHIFFKCIFLGTAFQNKYNFLLKFRNEVMYFSDLLITVN